MSFFRGKRSGEVTQPPPDSTAVIDMMVEEARARIDRQFSNNDAHDVKAAAVLAAAGVIGPIVITFRSEYGRSWPVPVGLSVIVAVLAAATLFPRNYEPGPRLREFYERHGGERPAQAARQLFSELLRAHERNECPLKVKNWTSTAALLSFFLIPVVSALSWLAWH